MDYPHRARLKIYAHVETLGVDDDPKLTALVTVPGYKAKLERIFRLRLETFDWELPATRTAHASPKPRFTGGRAHARASGGARDGKRGASRKTNLTGERSWKSNAHPSRRFSNPRTRTGRSDWRRMPGTAAILPKWRWPTRPTANGAIAPSFITGRAAINVVRHSYETSGCACSGGQG